jgi:peptidoglycan/LPS O-acetylase OafA/YrhL
MRTEVLVSQAKSIARDLAWTDLLKGVAIMTVFFGNWVSYVGFDSDAGALSSLGNVVRLAIGPGVQVFFVLSGFGLTMSYLRNPGNQNWSTWAWRRFVKVCVPYFLAVAFMFILGMLGSRLYPSVNLPFSWTTPIAYLTFTRNFFADAWEWNRTMWFMSVIVGLYFLFPLLIKVLEKRGVRVLLLISAAVSIGSITLWLALGLALGHQSDLFTFWTFQFALGMVLAYVRHTQPEKLDRLIGFKPFLLGVGVFGFSWWVRNYVPFGKTYNDLLSTIGIFLIFLNVCWLGWTHSPTFTTVANRLGKQSYIMYLLHYPILAFLIGPLLPSPAHPIVLVVGCVLFFAGVYLLSVIVSPLIDRLTSRLKTYPKTVAQ